MNHILLFESYNSQKEIEKLTYQLFKYTAEKTNKETKNSIIYIPNIYLSDYPELLNEYVELKEFIEKGKCFIDFTRNNKKKSEGGFSFNNYGREIILYYTDEFLDKLNEYYTKEYDLAPILYYEFYETLLHELQHAYDHYRSKGKALLQPHKFNKDKIKKTNLINTFDEGGKLTHDEIDFLNKHFDQYLNLKHEVDARFTTALSKLRIFKSKYDDNFEPSFYYVTPWTGILRDFKTEMFGWDKLTPKEKNRLIRRLYQFYEYEKDKAEKMNKEIKKTIKESINNTLIKDFLQDKKFINNKSKMFFYHGTNIHPDKFELRSDYNWEDSNEWGAELPEGYLFLTTSIKEASAYGQYIIPCELYKTDNKTFTIDTNNPSVIFDRDYGIDLYKNPKYYGFWEKYLDSGRSNLVIKGTDRMTIISPIENIIPRTDLAKEFYK